MPPRGANQVLVHVLNTVLKALRVEIVGGSIAAAAEPSQVVDLARIDYSGTPVTTLAYNEVIAALSADVNELFIFDSSGQTLVLAVGGVGSEQESLYIVPGGNGIIRRTIPAGSRVAVKAISATANVGELSITFSGAP